MLVQEILEEARRAAGKGPVLAMRLEERGVRGERGARYSESAISNWVKGRAMPPADVLLAAASLAGISLDRKLATIDGRHPTEGGGLTDQDAREVESQLAQIREELIRQRDSGGEAGERLAVLESNVATLTELVRRLHESVDVVQERLLQGGARQRRHAAAEQVPSGP